MRQWVEVYSASEILQPIVAEIGWSHHQQILTKCNGEHEREFYIRMAASLQLEKHIALIQKLGQEQK